jgi:HK97 family phage major capsid protein
MDFLRRDIADQIGLRVDYFCLNGQGAASEPMGILNTPGIGATTFGGTASWSSVLSFEQALAQNNADTVPGARLGWITSPGVRSRWKTIAKVGINTSGSVVPVFIWESGNFSDSNDGLVNSYRAAVTNNTPNNQVLFGNWTDLLLGFWFSVIFLTVDPYTSAESDEINFTAHLYCDVAVRHPQSFAVSADSGAQ